jgi:hypothetical protein
MAKLSEEKKEIEISKETDDILCLINSLLILQLKTKGEHMSFDQIKESNAFCYEIPNDKLDEYLDKIHKCGILGKGTKNDCPNTYWFTYSPYRKSNYSNTTSNSKSE